ncbi:MAG TPA: flagellar motor switch protein FliM, partial [Nitrosospira sp.]|nr:flagellar motor switch protein FliM [Nitrosospira sp.]
MTDDFLSPEEVDALLRGMARSSGRAQDDNAGSNCRPYNLATQERIVRGRMPTLEIINERFARLLRLGLFNFMRRSANVTAGPVRVIKFSEFVR